MNNQHPSLLRCPQVMLEAKGLWKSYPDGRVDAVRGVDLVIHQDEYVAIMGPSGSGKSTLLNLLGALDTPTQGELRFGDQPYAPQHQMDAFRARHLGFIFQSFCLIPTLTALENVQVPMLGIVNQRKERVARANELLEAVGLGHRKKHLPTKLSVGERQRVAIARSLANQPKLLLADEPTGNLDSARAGEILDLFDKLREDRQVTLVVVTHSAEVAARADRTLYFNDGQIAQVEKQSLLLSNSIPRMEGLLKIA